MPQFPLPHDHPVAFCQYLVDQNVADIRMKEASANTVQLCQDGDQAGQSDRLQRTLWEWTSTTR